MRIVNLNAWIGMMVRGLTRAESIEAPGGKQRRTDAMVAELRELDADVITLQECLPQPSFVREVAAALDMDLIFRVCNSGIRIGSFGIPRGVGRGEGLAILAKKSLAMKKVSVRRLSGWGISTNWCAFHVDAIRYCIVVKVRVDGVDCLVATTHVTYSFPNSTMFHDAWGTLYEEGVVKRQDPPTSLRVLLRKSRKRRDRELERLRVRLLAIQAAHSNIPLVLGADFNLDPEAPQVKRFGNMTGYANVLPQFEPDALTWDPAKNPNVKLGLSKSWPDGTPKGHILQLMAYLDDLPQTPDHIFVSPQARTTRAWRVFDSDAHGAYASDHYGLCADIDLKTALALGPPPE